MLVAASITALALLGSAVAQRPTNTSICDYYTTALLKNNTADNQYALLTLVVNTVVIGNYTKPNVGIMVPGILANGTYNGTMVDLLPYFDGGLASSNRNGSAVAVNFLDDGGAAPLKMNKPANGTSSNQYFLLTHLYQFFGSLLGCTQQGMPGFSAYLGDGSMAEVHQFMNLDPYQMGYFITQVGLAAASFGVTADDATAVGMALAKLFDYKCSPPTEVIKGQGAQLQAMCIADACPLAANATCSSYPVAVDPFVANPALAEGQGNSSSTASMAPTGVASMTEATTVAGMTGTAGASMTGTASGSAATPASTGAATKMVGGSAAAALALVAFIL